MTVTALPARRAGGTFRHDAFLYRDEQEFVTGTAGFIRDGLAADEPVLVALIPKKLELLRGALGPDADRVLFADMSELGLNPARIIPAWHDFVATHHTGTRAVRGVGEPIWEGRRAPEVAEAQLHEALLNVAFDSGPGWWLRCPYDVAGLDPSVLDAARGCHPSTVSRDSVQDSGDYEGHSGAARAFGAELPEPAHVAATLHFGPGEVIDVRRLTVRHAGRARLDELRTDRLGLAAHELATNSVRHGGGRGTLRVWRNPDALVLEISDRGRIRQPLVGRRTPDLLAEGGRGVWLVNQLCDLVQLRSSDAGTRVRIHTWLT
jgi:anti-sigma regulatory factor (Ser/Thr protein kinase)